MRSNLDQLLLSVVLAPPPPHKGRIARNGKSRAFEERETARWRSVHGLEVLPCSAARSGHRKPQRPVPPPGEKLPVRAYLKSGLSLHNMSSPVRGYLQGACCWQAWVPSS
eukprot:6209468-Pleurochrysis_carterae.AAC.4